MILPIEHHLGLSTSKVLPDSDKCSLSYSTFINSIEPDFSQDLCTIFRSFFNLNNFGTREDIKKR